MENRFFEMDSRLRLLKKGNRSASFSFGKSRRPMAAAFEAVNYTIPGVMGPLRQPTGMVCWATVATMMISWKRQQSLSIESAIGSVGQNWLQKFRNNQGLDADEKVPFLQAAGFEYEFPQSVSIVGWEQMLRRYGPIWVTTDEDPSVRFAIHARIISAIRGDGTAENTFLKITDPARGNQYEEKFADFLRKYEDEVRTSGASWSGRIQIVHWPQGAGAVSQSLSNERTQSWSVSQAGVAMIKRFEGFRGNLYNDPVGHCSVGYGELVHRGNCNGDATEQPYRNGITEQGASQLLLQRLNNFQRLVNDSVTVELNQNQYDSLVSFSYNVGSGNFRQSTLLRVLNQGNYGAVPTELRKWTKGRVNGRLVDLPGLVNRRNEEANLFAGTATAQSLSNYSEEASLLPAPDLATLLDDAYPVRQLTITQARNILETLHQTAPGEINLHNPGFSSSALVPKTAGGETHNTARPFTVQPSVINGVQFRYMNAAASGIVLSNMNNLDPRMVVFLYKFTRWLKNNYGVDTVYHMGIGHGNAAHPFDCHNTGRAIDFGGLKGTKDGNGYELFVLRDWGSKPVHQENGSMQYRLSASDGLGYNLFKDIYNYMVTQMSDTSNFYQGPRAAADLPARQIQDNTPIPSHAFIIHPDHQSSDLRRAHQNHIHAQVGATSLEANPPV